MQKLISNALGILVIASATNIYAQEASSSTIVSSNNQLVIQYISPKISYTEKQGSTTLDTEFGSVPGYAIALSAMKDFLFGKDFVKAQYSKNKGRTAYVGSLIGGTFGSLRQSSNAKFEDASLQYGKGFNLPKDILLTPFVEIGIHQWDRSLGPIGGYNETYKHNYRGVGAMAQFAPTEKIVLSASSLIGRTNSAKISTSLGVFPSGSLGSSSFNRYGMSFDYAFTQSFHANLGLDYTNFNYGKSQINSSGFFEPDSGTKLTTLKAGIGYVF